MKTVTLALFATALCLSIGCGDDDDGNNATGGSAGAGHGGKAGVSSGGATSGGKAGAGSGGKAGAGSGGKSSGGGGNPSGGENPGGAGAGGVGGSIPEAGAGGVPVTPPPVQCTPPSTVFGAGGAANAGGADGAGGAFEDAGAGGVSNGSRGVAIRGSYSDNWGSHHVITNSTWTTGSSVFHVSIVNNGAKYLIAQNDQSNTWNPCLWSRYDWTRSEGKLYYCQTAYNAATEAAALATPPADPSDPATSGCGGFSWTELSPE